MLVMAGLVPAIQEHLIGPCSWVAGTSPAMTDYLRGHEAFVASG